MVVSALAQTKETAEPVSLRGVFTYNGSTLFSLKCNKTGGSVWVAIGQPIFGGSIQQYHTSEHSVVFVDYAGSHLISLPQESEFNANFVFREELKFDFLADYNTKAKPYSEAPAGVKGMPASALVAFLVQEGYQVPAHVVDQARSQAIAKAIQDENKIKYLEENDASDKVQWRPRTPTHVTSLTDEQKILKRIVGYAE